MSPVNTLDRPPAETRPPRFGHHPLVRHYLEMVVAMIVGMAVLGGLVSLVFAAAGCSDLLHHVGIRATVMATDMTIGMSAYMLYRGHRWPAIAEMSLAMYVPLLVMLVPYLLGAIPGSVVLGPMHLLMLPAMAIVMLRRPDEYIHCARRGHVLDGQEVAEG